MESDDDDDSECPICLERGAKVILCPTSCMREIRYHPSCIASLEEAGFARCPICRQPCDLKAKNDRELRAVHARVSSPPREREQEEHAPAPPSRRQPRRDHPCLVHEVLPAAWIVCAMATLVLFLVLGLVYAFVCHIYDVENLYAWIYPAREVRFNMTSPSYDMIKADHPEVSEADWRDVLEWVRETDDGRSITVVTNEGPIVDSSVSFMGDGFDFRVHPKKCRFTRGPERCDDELTVHFMTANHFRQSMYPFEWSFALQSAYAALFAFTCWSVVCRHMPSHTAAVDYT